MALIDLSNIDWFQKVCLLLASVMLIWNTIEVGRNDAANLVNAVFGSRVLTRRKAVVLAGCAVVLGAVFSSAVIDTARKGIFSPSGLQGIDTIDALRAALAIFVSVYLVNTVLLYCYSAFGMPVSTTACLVFALLGGALGIHAGIINWNKAGAVMAGILCSVVLSGFAAFLIQRAARGAIRERCQHLPTLLLHGGWVGGGLSAGLGYFLLLKGMKNIPVVKQINVFLARLNESSDMAIAGPVVVLIMWGIAAIVIHLLLVVYRKRAAKLLFPVLAVLGMLAMAFAFGQNDLANCASPGLAVFHLVGEQDVTIASEAKIATWMLLGCGLLLFAGMCTESAARITKAEVATGSMGDHVALWAPRWCITLAGNALRFRGKAPALAPRAGITEAGKTMHYDALRACVMMSVSASVVATASSMGLPVSTTYVAFAAVIATGMADRIFQRGDAELKLGRVIWVVASWFFSAVIALASTFVVVKLVYWLGIWGVAVCLVVNLVVRHVLKRRADLQATRVEEEAHERAHPEEFALEFEDA